MVVCSNLVEHPDSNAVTIIWKKVGNVEKMIQNTPENFESIKVERKTEENYLEEEEESEDDEEEKIRKKRLEKEEKKKAKAKAKEQAKKREAARKARKQQEEEENEDYDEEDDDDEEEETVNTADQEFDEFLDSDDEDRRERKIFPDNLNSIRTFKKQLTPEEQLELLLGDVEEESDEEFENLDIIDRKIDWFTRNHENPDGPIPSTITFYDNNDGYWDHWIKIKRERAGIPEINIRPHLRH